MRSRARRSLWRLPWPMVTAQWMRDLADLAGGAPLGDDPISGAIGCVMVLPMALLLPFWLLELVLELVLWPFFLLVRVVARGVT